MFPHQPALIHPRNPPLTYNDEDNTVRTLTGRVVAHFNKDTGYLHFTNKGLPNFTRFYYTTSAIDLAIRKAPTTVLGFK